MKKNLEFNPLYRLYDILNYELTALVHDELDGYENVDNVIKYILESNGCTRLKDLSKAKDAKLLDDLHIYFIYTKNNEEEKESEQYCDVISIYGMTYIVVFLDFFKHILVERIVLDEDNEFDINLRAKSLLGNNIYYNAIKSICAIACNIIQPVRVPTVSAAYSLYNVKAPIFIAAKILDNILELKEEDIEGEVCMQYVDIMMNIRNVNMQLLLIGGRV